MALDISTIDATSDSPENVNRAIAELRRKLSPQGDVVSEAGRQKTMEVFGQPLTPQQVVEKICADIREQGLPAVLDYAARIDGVRLDVNELRVAPEALAQAHAAADRGFLDAVRRIRDNIREFQSAILHQDVHVRRPNGTRLQQRYLPLRRAGLCVPGGAAAYPSSVLMTAVPAQAAGVEQLAVVAPPTDFGANNPDILAVCHELGITEVYRVGGAQAVAALAYGVDGIPVVDKIVGPGNLFVALAKKLVYGQVDIDSIAGPSEVIVLADATTNPRHAAADLLAQAEHAPGSSILITWDRATLTAIKTAIADQLNQLSRSALTRTSLEDFAALILVRDRQQACDLTDLFAPEHLHIAAERPRELLADIRNAGATFVGPLTPVALGDYVAGPSHVLPTGGTARWASGLSANDFLRSSSVLEFTASSLRKVADDVRELAVREQLTAHWESVRIRLDDSEPS